MEKNPALAPATTEQNPSPEQLAAWETQYPGFKQVSVDDGKLVCFKRPDRTLVGMANAILSTTRNPTKYGEILLKNCQLNWQEATATDDELYYALLSIVDSLISAKTAEILN